MQSNKGGYNVKSISLITIGVFISYDLYDHSNRAGLVSRVGVRGSGFIGS